MFIEVILKCCQRLTTGFLAPEICRGQNQWLHRGKNILDAIHRNALKTVLYFCFQVEHESVLTTYTVNELSMMKYVYECVMFVVRKPENSI